MRLFISYARVDMPMCEQIVQRLQGAHDVWYDRRLYAGDAWWDEIVQRIDWCDGFVFLMSPESVTSKYCQREFDIATSRAKTIIPVLIQTRTTIPDKLRNLHYVDLSAGLNSETVSALLDSVVNAERKMRVAQSVPPDSSPSVAHESVSRPAAREKRATRLAPAVIGVAALFVLLGAVWWAVNNLNNASNAQSTATATPDLLNWQPETRDFDGVRMVKVPAGCFNMGDPEGEPFESPVTQVCLEQFWLDQTEITNEQFSRLGGTAETFSQWGDPQRPRETITWFEARDFCTQRDGRLPSEAEWEYAARGTRGVIYPWGNNFIGERALYGANASLATGDVGLRPAGASWVGALDMSGNVAEWVNTIFDEYPYNAADGREDSRDEISARVVRGGAWSNAEQFLRASYRISHMPMTVAPDIGFRCARSE
jgi:formylglycine-generating enzyme required for sulfatase activity